MTLASRLLEGYYPEGYDIVEEGLTPDIVMDRVNSVCMECITALYEAAEDYFTGDLVAQAQVLTEGAGVVDKLKELIGKFVDKIKKIWKWFTDKVKRFPAWLKSLFSKVEENSEKIAEKFEGIGIKHRMVEVTDLSVLDKYISEVESTQSKIKNYSDKLVSIYGKVDLIGLLGSAERIVKDAAKNQGNTGVDNKKFTESINRMWNADARDGMIDDLEKFSEELTLAQKKVDSAKTVSAEATKVSKYAIKIKKASMSADSGIVKPVENTVKIVESTLSAISAPSFQSRLEHAFADNDTKGHSAGVVTNYAQSYISQSSKILSAVVADMNKLMGLARSIISGYQSINSKLVSAVRSKSDDNEGKDE